MFKVVIQIAIGFLTCVYSICRLFPTKQRIVCLSRTDSGVPIDFRLIQEWFQKNRPDWQVVIQVHSTKNKIAYFFELLKETYYIATSRAVVIERICIPVSLLRERIKAPVIQIWHALGNMKKFGYTVVDTPEGHSSEYMATTHMHEGYDAVAISSMAFADDFAAGFNVDPSIMFEAPLPRVDLLSDSAVLKRRRAEFLAEYPQLTQKKTILYCPTYRKSMPANQDEAMQALVDAIDFEKYNFVYKPHPLSTYETNDKRVVTIRTSIPNPMFAADYVISDYSTIIYEVGLIGLPMYLYTYDWDEYKHTRGLNFELLEEAPVLNTNDPTKIMQAIAADEFDHAGFKAFLARNIALPEGKSATQHMCEEILRFAQQDKTVSSN